MINDLNKINYKQEEKKKNFFLSLTLIIFALCVTGATYAYFALTASNNAITGTVGGATLSLTVSKVVPTTQTTNMIPQLESTLDEAISSTYNCVDDHDNVVCQVYKATITNTGDSTTELSGTISFTYTTDTSYTVEEKLPNLKWKRITNATTLGEYNTYSALSSEQDFESSIALSPDGSQDYYFVVWIDETGEVQNDSGTFRAVINFESADGNGLSSTIRPNFAEHIVSLYNDGSTLTTANIEGDTNLPSVSLNATQGIMLDNNGVYRYYGKTPNNYVEYNGELWRIISVSNVKSSGEDTTGETRVKIVRYDTIGQYVWDVSDETINTGAGVNDWTQADLMTTLNTTYYNKETGFCYDGYATVANPCDFRNIGLNNYSKNLIDNAYWNLGGVVIEDADNPYISLNDMYDDERGTTTYDCTNGDDGACPRATSWTGKVGLIYPSDYGYAADLGLCQKNVLYYGIDENWRQVEDDCVTTNWMFNDWGFYTISPSGETTSPSNAIRIWIDGSVFSGRIDEIRGATIYPVVYLKSNVTIAGGNGSSEKPYKISI